MPVVRRIEIVGVAGTGKSTLARALVAEHDGFRAADSLHTRLPAHWPYVAHGLPSVLALLVRTAHRRPLPSWEEVELLVYVAEWGRYLAAREAGEAGVVVLDQGPIFSLARLLWGRKPITREEAFRGWLEKMLERWSTELDAVVWLVAPEDTLLERIGSRVKRHDAKGIPREDGRALLAAHREAYERILGELGRIGAPRVLHYDTSALTAPQIADELEAILSGGETGRLTDAGFVMNVGEASSRRDGDEDGKEDEWGLR